MARMSRRTKRKIGLITILVVLLALLTLLYVNFLATKKIGFDVAVDSGDTVTAPQFLYSFAGKAPNQLQRPSVSSPTAGTSGSPTRSRASC